MSLTIFLFSTEIEHCCTENRYITIQYKVKWWNLPATEEKETGGDQQLINILHSIFEFAHHQSNPHSVPHIHLRLPNKGNVIDITVGKLSLKSNQSETWPVEI